MSTEISAEETPKHFIQKIIEADIAANEENDKVTRIITRFPPEPNGYLHIGHVKSICLNFNMARQYQGVCNLRFDDTNPEKESQEYINAIKEDIRWLGFDWQEPVHYASDYFDHLFECACDLIAKGLAYVDLQSPEVIRTGRGNLTQAGINSPFRDVTAEENLALFKRMRDGEFADGAAVLRAKIDMASPNMNMRDPVIYRVRHIEHHQTGTQWCIYPMYDFTHPLSDAFENISHSLCTLEFEDHRPFYDWLLDSLADESIGRPRQYEFSRLELNYTVTSKRKLKQLVDEGVVLSWSDPRMPTIAGMRRRGFSAASLRKFCDMIGVTKSQGVVDMGMLEHAIRDDLNTNAPRRMCVLNPVKIVMTNFPETQEKLTVANHPKDESFGQRIIDMGREIYIDSADFREEANKKYKRLVLGKEVRLRGSYVIKAHEVIKDEAGEITAIHCTYDAQTLGKNPEDRKVKGVIHWVSAETAIDCTVNLYDRLFEHEAPASTEDFMAHINPNSLQVLTGCKAEAELASAEVGQAYQFEREGYFCLDADSEQNTSAVVFNRTISLRDTWTK